MGNKAIISRDQIVDAAYGLALDRGLGALSIRAVASACGISVGTVYHSFATKSELVNSVVGKFWQEAFAGIMEEADEGPADFLEFCRHLSRRMGEALAEFRKDFLSDLSALSAADMKAAHQREEKAFAHGRRGLQQALAKDERIRRDQLGGEAAADALCDLVWCTIVQAARTGRPIDEPLFTLIKEALY